MPVVAICISLDVNKVKLWERIVKFIECIKVCLSLPFVFLWMLIKLNFGSELGYDK